ELRRHPGIGCTIEGAGTTGHDLWVGRLLRRILFLFRLFRLWLCRLQFASLFAFQSRPLQRLI
ncbi:MAG TPA: hypothetical protein VHS28_10590, partial [Chloroflexota bacterium]|nr:hypothetical protein [Chloroflexota bacterium]